MIEDTIEEIKGLIKPGQHIENSYNGREDLYFDRKLLKNILFNLISNAIKFSEPGATITLSCHTDAENTLISVADKGIGISEEDQEHLFSSFFRGANASNIQGTGLGLHIVKRYIDLLGGRAKLHSELDKGTTVTVEFPSAQ